MRRHIFIDFVNKGYSHFFFNTEFIKKNMKDDEIIEFYTFQSNYSKYNEYFINKKSIVIKAYFLEYGLFSASLNYLVNCFYFLFLNKNKPSSIVILSSDYTVFPSFLYLFPTKNVQLILHQVRFAKSKNWMKIILWKILMKNKSIKFTLLSISQLNFLISNNFSVKSCVVFFHPFYVK